MRTMVSRLAISAALLMLVAVGVANAQNCSSSIQACGCTINSAGAYTVDSDLTAAQGLTSRGSCIDVAAANVKLFTNGHNITGAGTGTGVGINLLSTAGSLFLAAAGPNSTYTTVSGWQYGMQSLADNVTSEGFYFSGNSTGVLIKDADNNNLSCFGAYNNSVYGVWVRAGSGNQIDFGGAWNNGVAGVYLGCSGTGPSGQACTGSSHSPSGNFIFEVFSYPGPPPQSYGIAVEKGSKQNSIVDNFFLSNSVDDLFDGNTSGANVWHANKYATANQSFIQ